MLGEVTDLGRVIEGQIRVLIVQRPSHTQSVPWAIQKIRIAKRNVPRPLGDEVADIFKDCMTRHGVETSSVERWNRTVQA